MKKVFLLPLFVILLAVFSFDAFAISNDQSVGKMGERLEELRLKRQEIRDRNLEKRQMLQENLQENREAKKEQFKGEAATRIRNAFAVILRRYNAALLRLDKISERLASRIDKLKAKGVDTSKAEADLAAAEAAGAEAQAAIDAAQTAVDSIDTSSGDVRSVVSAAKDAVKNAKESLKKYHKALVLVTRDLKASADLRSEEGEHAN
ncbi:MAG: hypothetical protein NUV69_01235 [Candidatus Curtissbacteria bacterium]|nr:hypothetical protein [Candidatus Curtissbacteria bacterium]